ncbi:MAG TPA: hypothetical protein VLE49_16795 [Anaerolineales bacterium]|nr:hypothetical protein [Anaerolineales bacterium]
MTAPDIVKNLVERFEQHRTQLRREIESMDQQLDTLVCELYGLSPDEIKIVEGQA